MDKTIIYKALSGYQAPLWLWSAMAYLGVREVPGKEHNGAIVRWLRELKAWWSDDETPWCGTFVAQCMREGGVQSIPKHWYRALAWLDWGVAIQHPRVGCVVVFNRKGGGHVGFVLGRDLSGRLLVIGGNQGNAVTVAPFDVSRVAGYRMPKEKELQYLPLPTIALATGVSSTNEA